MIPTDLSKQQALDVRQAVIQTSYTGTLEEQSTIFVISQEAKETVLDFSQVIVKVF